MELVTIAREDQAISRMDVPGEDQQAHGRIVGGRMHGREPARNDQQIESDSSLEAVSAHGPDESRFIRCRTYVIHTPSARMRKRIMIGTSVNYCYADMSPSAGRRTGQLTACTGRAPAGHYSLRT